MLKYLIVGFFLSIVYQENGQFGYLIADRAPALSRDSIDLNRLLNVQWEYSNSFSKDTTVFIDDLGDLPKRICFCRCTSNISIDINNPISSLISNNEFKGICSKHEKYSNITVSRPVINKSKTSKQIRVTHYGVSGKAFIKAFDYFITDLSTDTLVLKNERYYNIGGKDILLLHVFVKQRELKPECN